MIKLKSLISEYVTNPIVDLAKYLQSSDKEKAEELANYIASNKVYDWIKKTHPQLENQINGFDNSDEAVLWLSEHYPQIHTQFSQYVYKMTNSESDMYDTAMPGSPSWYYMDFRGYVKNQWLIHFSDRSKEIWRDQKFKYGMDDYTALGLTTYYKDEPKKYGGYNFAYDIADYAKYGRSSYQGGRWKYGKEAVIFKASGVKVWHHGDEEPQVIFLGNTAKDIVHLEQTDPGPWGVVNSKKGNTIFIGELPDVVKWVVKNFDQYKAVLLP
jgi:hypothetical protein